MSGDIQQRFLGLVRFHTALYVEPTLRETDKPSVRRYKTLTDARRGLRVSFVAIIRGNSQAAGVSAVSVCGLEVERKCRTGQ